MERTPFYPPFEEIWSYYTFIIANPSGFCLAYLMKNFYYSVTPPDFVEIFQTFPHGFGPEGGGVRRKPRRFRTFSHRKSRRAAPLPRPRRSGSGRRPSPHDNAWRGEGVRRAGGGSGHGWFKVRGSDGSGFGRSGIRGDGRPIPVPPAWA